MFDFNQNIVQANIFACGNDKKMLRVSTCRARDRHFSHFRVTGAPLGPGYCCRVQLPKQIETFIEQMIEIGRIPEVEPATQCTTYQNSNSLFKIYFR